LYYLSFCKSVIVQLQELTFGGAAGAAAGDTAQAAPPPEHCNCLDFDRAFGETFCLVAEAFCTGFLVF
jgi:hypothetical protein